MRQSDDILSLGVLIGHPTAFRGDPSSAGQEMLAGLSDAAAQKNATLAIHFVPPDSAGRILQPDRQPPAMRAGRLGGLILLYPFPESVVKELSRRWPCVSIVHHYADLPVDCIDSDQADSVARLVGHLLGQGHRRIGFLGWGRRASWERRRFHGYVQGLAAAGLPVDPTVVLNLDGPAMNEAEEVRRVVALLSQGVRAWVCAADHVGYHLCRRLERRGIVVGRDVSVTGYDGMPVPPDCRPLTTVRVPFQEMGFAALRRLLYRIEEPAALVRDIVLRTELILGETTAPPGPEAST